MANFALIGICILAGMLLRRSKLLPADAHRGVNAWILYIALPAVSFKYLPHVIWNTNSLLPIVAPMIVWVGAWFFMALYTYKQKIDKPTIGGLQLTSGLANTSFVGFPLVMAYFGEQQISIAIICDQVTFFLLSTVGLVTAISSTGKAKLSVTVILNKLFLFPPFLGCLGALIIPNIMDVSPLQTLFDKLAGTVGPLALFSIGLQLQFEGWRSELKHISAVLLYKLLFAPALIFGFALLLHLTGPEARISIFEAAMPCLLTAAVVADEYEMNPRLINLVIAISIVVGFVTTAGWWWVIKTFVNV